jgi:HlyD family secretion protein
LSKRELDRQTRLFNTGAVAANDIDRARLTHERNVRMSDEIAAEIATAGLGARPDAVAAAEAEVAAAGAAKERADWAVTQKAQAAPSAALVYDTLYREGEFVTAGTPVVTLLPPENLKVRFFVSETDFSTLKVGDRVRVAITGRTGLLDARINYLATRPEYTPPVLYNRDNRSKLVFMVEAAIDAAVARELNPGQPVDVTLGK